MVTFYGISKETKKDDRYFKFKDGSNKFRILGKGIEGWEFWDNKQPTRTETNKAGSNGWKYFVAWTVWDYAEERIKILFVNQQGIIKSLGALAMSEDWGDLTTYDVIVSRRTEGKYIDPKDGTEKPSVKYDVMGVPPKPLKAEIVAAMKENKVNLRALFENKDPFKDFEAGGTSFVEAEPETISEGQAAAIDMMLEDYGTDKRNQELFICSRYNVPSLYDLPKDSYDEVMKHLREGFKGGRKHVKSA